MDSIRNRLQIGVIGGRSAEPHVLAWAEDAGRGIARRHAVLVCGGMGGVMEAACRGAKMEGGSTVGILPGTALDKANQYVDYAVATGMGFARNAVIIQSVSGVIAIGGRYGTLSEIGFALQKGIPVVSLSSWDLGKDILQAKSPDQAVDMLFNLLKV